MRYTRLAKVFLGFMAVAAFATICGAAIQVREWHPARAVTLLVAALATSRMKVKIPGITGNMSVSLPFMMLSVISLNATESILIACASTAIQTLPSDGSKLKPVRLLFNLSMMAISCGVAGLFFHRDALPLNWSSAQLLLAGTGVTFFLGQTIPVSIIIALTDGGAVRRIWSNIVHMTLPYYVVSAGVTSMVGAFGQPLKWLPSLAALPVMYGIYRSYRLYWVHAGPPINPSMA